MVVLPVRPGDGRPAPQGSAVSSLAAAGREDRLREEKEGCPGGIVVWGPALMTSTERRGWQRIPSAGRDAHDVAEGGTG